MYVYIFISKSSNFAPISVPKTIIAATVFATIQYLMFYLGWWISNGSNAYLVHTYLQSQRIYWNKSRCSLYLNPIQKIPLTVYVSTETTVFLNTRLATDELKPSDAATPRLLNPSFLSILLRAYDLSLFPTYHVILISHMICNCRFISVRKRLFSAGRGCYFATKFFLFRPMFFETGTKLSLGPVSPM